MIRSILLFLLAACCYADSKTEADLRARLAAAERARVALVMELSRINSRTAATLAATKSKATADVASAHAEVAQATAEENAAAAKESADKATVAVKQAAIEAHKDAESIASKIFVSSGPFIIAQTFFATLAVRRVRLQDG